MQRSIGGGKALKWSVEAGYIKSNDSSSAPRRVGFVFKGVPAVRYDVNSYSLGGAVLLLTINSGSNSIC